jgi:hypothetical protein
VLTHYPTLNTLTDDPCFYSGLCKECLSVLRELPHRGFQHACGSLIVSRPKPPKQDPSKNKRKLSEYDPGAPSDPNFAAYIPSESRAKIQKLKADAAAKQLKRKQREAEDQALADQAERESKSDLFEFDDEEMSELTQEELAEQDLALATMQVR